MVGRWQSSRGGRGGGVGGGGGGGGAMVEQSKGTMEEHYRDEDRAMSVYALVCFCGIDAASMTFPKLTRTTNTG